MIGAKPRPIARKLKERQWTFAELADELPESNLPTELWDGELVMSPSPSFQHQAIVMRVYKQLDAWVTRHQLGTVAVAPLDMVLTTRRSVQPDLMFVSKARQNIIQKQITQAADLVVEVVSPDSRRRDRIDKRDLYEQHGVREYWLIDPEAQTVEVLFLEAGQYRLVGRWRPGEQARSRLLKSFTAEVGAVFGEGK